MKNEPQEPSECPECGIPLPYAEPSMGEEVTALVRSIVLMKQDPFDAVTELNESLKEFSPDGRNAGGRKIAFHRCGHIRIVQPITGTCPFCDGELRSPEATQCRHCKRDWHDPNNIKTL